MNQQGIAAISRARLPIVWMFFSNFHQLFSFCGNYYYKIIKEMNLVFNKEEEYISPMCMVYSVNLEGSIAIVSGENGTPVDWEDPEDPDGND